MKVSTWPVLLLAAFSAGPTAPAQTVRRADPAKPLEIVLVATTQYATHDFYAHTANGAGPDFRDATSIFPGQRIDLVVLAKNYSVNASKRASLIYDLDITYPGGKTQRAGHDLRLCVGPVPDITLLAYAGQNASFSAESGDPLGNYIFAVTAQDRVAGTSTRKTVTLQVAPYVEPLLPTGFNPSGWMASYYLNPSPELALPALFKIAASLSKDNTDAWPPILGFYEEVLKANPWLAAVFLDRLKNANAADRTLLLFVLGYAWRNDPTYADLSKGPWPDADRGDFNDPMQLDLLWGRFFATGAFAPVDRIASALTLHRSLGALERFKANPSAATSKGPTPEMMQELILKAAQWSLGANAYKHPLVRRYLEWILAQQRPDPMFNVLLKTTLDAVHSAGKPTDSPSSP